MNHLLKDLEIALVNLRQMKPLVLCLTNFVTVDLVANSLLALGALPLMSQSIDEIDELISISQVAYLNIGTVDQSFCERAMQAAQLAKRQKKPVILDPVGAGASSLRTNAAKSLLPYSDIVRGNASEILSLVDGENETKGVETSHSVNQAENAANRLAASLQSVVAVSGPIDLITNGTEKINLPFGSPLMPLVTGMGCTLTAVIAAFAATGLNYYKATVLATAYFGLCGQIAHQQAQGPGRFRQLFIDNLFKPHWALFKEDVAAIRAEEYLL